MPILYSLEKNFISWSSDCYCTTQKKVKIFKLGKYDDSWDTVAYGIVLTKSEMKKVDAIDTDYESFDTVIEHVKERVFELRWKRGKVGIEHF